MDDEERKALDDLVARASSDYLNKRSLLILEAAVGCLLDTKSPEEAAAILREMADQLEAFG